MDLPRIVSVVGMGLIGGSLYGASRRAGYETGGFDVGDRLDLSASDLVLVALPPDVVADWFEAHAAEFKRGAVVVDTCGVKTELCRRISAIAKTGWTYVGGHPMAGSERSGSAFSHASMFDGRSMILTPDGNVPDGVVPMLEKFFGSLGFSKVVVTTPEHHDHMIAFTSHLPHAIAAAYVQDPSAGDVSGYAAGSYGDMTRIASMNPMVWESLFNENRESLLASVDDFICRISHFRDMLSRGDREGMRGFIAAAADSRASDGFRRTKNIVNPDSSSTIGDRLRLTVYGASHAPGIGMRMDNFPGGFHVDLAELGRFMERRAPGRDAMSTARREPDIPEFVSGIDSDGFTTGERIEALIRNTDVRKKDYAGRGNVPRPGHADFTQWVKFGKIPSGGGSNSGRMTAPMCIAGGICLQWLADRGIKVASKIVEIGGRKDGFAETVAAARADGDSVGGIIELTIDNLPPGLGGAMFGGLESDLSEGLFGIPAVKGVEFGNGFAAAALRGSENNDAFEIRDGRVVTATNRHGGILGGMSTGMPLVIRLAVKPTPSVFKTQRSVDLAKRVPAESRTKGRHDPCVAFRAAPAAEAVAAYVISDAIMRTESAVPRICLVLSESTLAADFDCVAKCREHIDMVELRVDCLDGNERRFAADFPGRVGLRTILTIRRKSDGGRWEESEESRTELFKCLLSSGRFAFVDFESDFHVPELERLTYSRGIAVIRSLHDFSGPVGDAVSVCAKLRGASHDIPKIAFACRGAGDLAHLFTETPGFPSSPPIICAMGLAGKASRILACRTGSMLTFVSPEGAMPRMAGLGHVTPDELVSTYGFRTLTASTRIYAVTGWPLEHTSSPELNNSAFQAAALDAVMVPIPAETPEESLSCAESLDVLGMAVTVPHKERIIPLLSSLDETAAAIGAVNTVVRTPGGWRGYNTDARGFIVALLDFLQSEDIRGRHVALVGTGGAARAVAYALSVAGADVRVFGRSPEKAAALAGKYGFSHAVLGPQSDREFSEYSDVIVQATSVGLGSDDPADDPIPFHRFTGTEHLFDLVYVPEVTPVMRRAAAAGCPVCNGMPMLVAQAEEQRRIYAENERRPL
ncbi:MAG: chorismate synthase [Victivallaceae bacterium]|nr:chorismate synthase [Victivallaceae bacterium]